MTLPFGCGWCDFESTLQSEVMEHIQTCPQHPLSAALAELNRLQIDVTCLQGKLTYIGNHPAVIWATADTIAERAVDALNRLESEVQSLKGEPP